MFALVLTVLMGCSPDPNAPAPRPSGMFEVREVETAEGLVRGEDMVRARFKGCSWGRMVWTFEEGALVAGFDVLCEGPVPTQQYGCEVRVTQAATWDGEASQFQVEAFAGARSRVQGTEAPYTVACDVGVEAGVYKVARMSRKKWRWEMLTPAGNVLRLAEAEVRPDFAEVLRRNQMAANSGGL